MVWVGVSPCADHNENVGQLYIRNGAGEPKCTVITFFIGGEFSRAITHDPTASVLSTGNVDYVASAEEESITAPSCCNSGFSLCTGAVRCSACVASRIHPECCVQCVELCLRHEEYVVMELRSTLTVAMQ